MKSVCQLTTCMSLLSLVLADGPFNVVNPGNGQPAVLVQEPPLSSLVPGTQRDRVYAAYHNSNSLQSSASAVPSYSAQPAARYRVDGAGGSSSSGFPAVPSSSVAPANGYQNSAPPAPSSSAPQANGYQNYIASVPSSSVPPANGYLNTANPTNTASTPPAPSQSVAPASGYSGTGNTGTGGSIAAGCTAEKPYGFLIRGGSGLTYANSGPDSQSGPLSESTNICVAASSVANLAISVGATCGHPGNSIIECGVPVNPSASNRPFCDISFVNGYSVSITCGLSNGALWQNLGSKTMGYAPDLFSNTCQSYDTTNKVCNNVRGADMSITDCAQLPDAKFFSPADVYGGSEGFWNSANAWPYDPTGMPTVVCDITSKGKSKRDEMPSLHGPVKRTRSHPRHLQH